MHEGVALIDIGIDAACWWNRRGFGRFTRGLLEAMFAAPRGHRFCLFVDHPAEPPMQRPHVRVVQVPVRHPVTASAVASSRRALRDVWHFSHAASTHGLDIMFFPAVYSWFPVRPGLPSVVTLHDAIPEHYPALIFPDRKARVLWSLKTRAAIWQARRILTVSEAARDEIVAHAGVEYAAIDVICEGAAPHFAPVSDPAMRLSVRQELDLPGDARLLLFVGAVAPHKNLANFAEGLARAAHLPGMADVNLAIVGDPLGDGFHSSHAALVRQVTCDARLRGRVHFTGYVSDAQLAALYSDALATVLPSFSEGFGLPVLESLACGTPVLTSARGAAPEVAGPAGLTFDPDDPAAIARQIHRIATDADCRAALRSAAMPRAGHYGWPRAARMVLQSLEACAKAA